MVAEFEFGNRLQDGVGMVQRWVHGHELADLGRLSNLLAGKPGALHRWAGVVVYRRREKSTTGTTNPQRSLNVEQMSSSMFGNLRQKVSSCADVIAESLRFMSKHVSI